MHESGSILLHGTRALDGILFLSQRDLPSRRMPMNRALVVLLVEDDPDHMEIFAAYLRHNGVEVVSTRSVDEGLRLAAERQPDVVVTGLDFGGQPRGLGLVRELRDTLATRRIPVLVHTAFADVWDRELRALNVPVVAKGQPPATLLAAIREALPILP